MGIFRLSEKIVSPLIQILMAAVVGRGDGRRRQWEREPEREHGERPAGGQAPTLHYTGRADWQHPRCDGRSIQNTLWTLPAGRSGKHRHSKS